MSYPLRRRRLSTPEQTKSTSRSCDQNQAFTTKISFSLPTIQEMIPPTGRRAPTRLRGLAGERPLALEPLVEQPHPIEDRPRHNPEAAVKGIRRVLAARP